MSRIILFVVLLAIDYSSFAQNSGISRPKLVVGLVVDQMRWDYMYKYYGQYGEGGFKRLMNDGFNCQNTMVNYLPTFTAPGHACIYTGSVPAIHGIAGNDFVDYATCTPRYCVEDKAERCICSGDISEASMSPRNLLVTTITDELRLATNFRSKVYGFALKDRGCIIPSGHLANGAYWYDDETGNFVTSTYYKNGNPEWLQKLNKRKLADSLVGLNWNLFNTSPGAYNQSIGDDNRYEGKLKGEAAPVFPHNVALLKGKDRYSVIKRTPWGNTLTFEAAKACANAEQMGKDEETDFLCVSLSSTDYVGHMFAPQSIEVQDVYMRLDRDIANFLSYLDKTVGKNNYLFFLTADHGGAHNPNYLSDINIPGGFLSTKMKAELNAHLKPIFNRDDIVLLYENYSVYLDDSAMIKNNINRENVKDAIISFLKQKTEISFVADMERLDKNPLPEPIRTMAINGYNRMRSGVILAIPNPGWFEGYVGVTTGTSHGTWNPYDAHIPLLWYGWHIPKGETYSVVNMTDIAATLAALLHIQMPSGCIGKPIGGVVK
jgi:hypothetical protein